MNTWTGAGWSKTTMTFIKGKPCLSNVINLFEEVTIRADRGEATNIICLDMKMAFDTGKLKSRYRVRKELTVKF